MADGTDLSTTHGSAKRMAAVVNPRGGKRRGLAILERVKPLFAERGVALNVHVTESAGHAREIARTMDFDGYDGLCIFGGDGTIHEVVDGLMHRDEPATVPLGFIPAGSGNTLHQHLECTDPIEAARRILAGNACPLDVVRVRTGERVVYCVDIVGWGGVADVNGTAERLRRLGAARYAIAALLHVFRAKRRRARVVLDGRVLEGEFLLIIACNGKYTGKGMKLAPHAVIGDGKIDVVLVRNASVVQMLRLLSKVFDGSHLSMSCVEYHQVRSFAIETEDPDPLDLDGEIEGRAPFDAEVIPGALRVFAGREGSTGGIY